MAWCLYNCLVQSSSEYASSIWFYLWILSYSLAASKLFGNCLCDWSSFVEIVDRTQNHCMLDALFLALAPTSSFSSSSHSLFSVLDFSEVVPFAVGVCDHIDNHPPRSNNHYCTESSNPSNFSIFGECLLFLSQVELFDWISASLNCCWTFSYLKNINYYF